MNDIERQLRDLGERTAQEVTHGEVPGRQIARRARRRRALSVAVPALAVVLSAAVVYPRLDLGSDGRLRPVNLAAAVDATESAGTARIEIDFSMEMPTGSSTMRGTGEVDFASGRSHMRFAGVGSSGAPLDFEVVTVGSSGFQRVAGDETWTRTKLPSGRTSAPLESAEPGAFLGYLESVSDDITDLGAEELDGVQVTHFRAVLDMPELTDGAVAGGTEIDFDPMDVWIDDRSRLRQMTFGASADGFTTTFTMRLSDFGIPVEVEEPRPEDVTDAPQDAGEWQDLEPEGDDPSGEDFGVTGATYVYGPAGTAETNILVASGEEPYSVLCIESLPQGTVYVTLVHAGTGRMVAAIHKHDLNQVGDTGLSVACMPGGIAEEDGEILVDDPSQYELRLDMKTGRKVIALTRADPLD